MTPFDKAYEQVKLLAEKFHGNLHYYKMPVYQEAEVRKDFIDKFFIALGWDVNHDEQHNPYEQEVKVEKGQKQDQATAQKRADYAFYLGPNFKDVQFFVEAKKPSVELKHPDNYFQTIRYGWNATTPLAILTDFEQFHIIDCRYKPDLRFVFTGQHKEFTYTDYQDKEKFAEIYWLFSREAVLDGSIKKFAASLPKLKGKKAAVPKELAGAIDDSFLEYIDGIREELAKAFKKNDEELGSEALTEVVTRTIDRLVFIRFLEDKLIEPENHVYKWRSWDDFVNDSRKFDAKYNGVVFKEHPLLDKKGFSGAEQKIFLSICQEMSSRNSPYDFNYIPIHILGSIYERFLGKIVVATDKRVRIEEKPEVRKAGGVYYTPKYIVDYIIQNTIGPCIENKSPKEIAELRFADIACGSGSFLIGAYDYLLDYHKKYYAKKYAGRPDPIDARNEDYGNVELKDGQWVLTLKLKQDILLNNIYGVDIDRQAVEVTQLSLFLKMLEDETLNSTKARQGALFSKVLPDLSKNIVCGNSLIGTDILQGQLFSFEDEKKLNPMDFESAFPVVMKNGGFDVIVGNPPYVRPHNLSKQNKEYFWEHYKSFTHKSDLYCCFIEKATSLINENGIISYIVSNGWLRLNSFQALRKLILNNYGIIELVELPFRVFADALVKADVFVFKKKNSSHKKSHKIKIIQGQNNTGNVSFSLLREIPQVAFESTFENVFDISISPETEVIKDKMRGNLTIGEVFDIRFGLKTGDDSKFIHSKFGLHKEDRKLLRGDDIKRYFYNFKGEYVWYVPEKMREHRKTARPGESERFEQPKVLIKDTSPIFPEHMTIRIFM